MSAKNETGQVKITVWQLNDFPYHEPVTVCTHLPNPYDDEVDVGRTGAIVPKNGEASFSIGFNLMREPAQETAMFAVQDAAERDLATGSMSLDKVLSDKFVPRTKVKLAPRGELEVEMCWVEAPHNPSQYFQIANLALRNLADKNVDPYVIILLNDMEVGRTETHAGGVGEVYFNFSMDQPYALYPAVTLLVCDEARGEEDPIGETTVDLWPLFKRGDKPCIEGWPIVFDSAGRDVGQIRIKLTFYDDPAERNRAPERLDAPPVTAEPADLDSVMSSSSSSSINPAIQQALDDAQKAAEAAEAEAAKAKEIADQLAALPLTAPEAKDYARQTAAAADSARAAARKARAVADELERDPRDLDRRLKEATDAAREAKDAKEKTKLKAKDAARISAREDAKAARDSARKAGRLGEDTHAMAANYPAVKQFQPLCNDADTATQDADHEAKDAKDHADACEDAPSLTRAFDEAAAAHAAALAAKAHEDEAEEILKRAQLLARKADKAAEKQQQKKAEEEAAAAARAAEARERQRRAEHEADQARRRANLRGPAIAEPEVYQSAAALDFHRAEIEPPVAQWNVCCATPLERGKSSDSLRGALPIHELRGQQEAVKLAAPYPILEGEGMLENKFAGRPRCFCCFMGCWRCCGEC